jgi:hypothetical protein
MLLATAAKHLLQETQEAFSVLISLILLTRFGSLIKGRDIETKSASPLEITASI